MTAEQLEILRHTMRNARYVSDPDADLNALVAAGLMTSQKAPSWCGSSHCYYITAAGRVAANKRGAEPAVVLEVADGQPKH